MARNTYVKTGGTFTVPNYVYAKNGGIWSNVQKIWVKSAGVWTQTWPETGNAQFLANGSFVVPRGVQTLQIIISGGSGGGGGGTGDATLEGEDPAPGNAGQAGYLDNRIVTVIPQEIITIYIGSGGLGGRNGVANCGGNGAIWLQVNANPADRRGLAGTAGYSPGGDGSGASCPNSFRQTGGWAGGGGAASAYVYSGGTIIAGGGNGGIPGPNYLGGVGAAGPGGSNGTGNQGPSGISGGAAGPAGADAGYGGDGQSGYATILW